ncbi:hypothetical protein BBJ28_00016613 [Nothophytophthora sp. Chile5]|nr:hypothetical protein BBJ28_00016613 [Nothophytophthora sp. Chile5]
MDGDVLPAKGKKGSKFIAAHLSRFGLKIGTRNQQTQLVETVVCRFCLAFGKEDDSLRENAASKPRRQSITPKHFNRFRTELFEGHMKRMHPLKWHDYTTLTTDEEKSDFFSSPPVPYVATMQAAFESEGAIQLTIKPAIINTIIGDLLFHPDDLEGVPHARAMAIFTDEGKHFMIDEKNPSRFRLCVRFMSRGASFRMAAALVNDTKEETGIDIERGKRCVRSLSPTTHEIIGRFAISHDVSLNYIQGLDLWVFDSVSLLDDSQKTFVVKAVGRAYALAASSI